MPRVICTHVDDRRGDSSELLRDLDRALEAIHAKRAEEVTQGGARIINLGLASYGRVEQALLGLGWKILYRER